MALLGVSSIELLENFVCYLLMPDDSFLVVALLQCNIYIFWLVRVAVLLIICSILLV